MTIDPPSPGARLESTAVPISRRSFGERDTLTVPLGLVTSAYRDAFIDAERSDARSPRAEWHVEVVSADAGALTITF